MNALISLGLNAALLIVLRRWIESRTSMRDQRINRVLLGLPFALAACASLWLSAEHYPGIALDPRGIFVALAAYFGGGIAGLVAAIPAALLGFVIEGPDDGITAAALFCAVWVGVAVSRIYRSDTAPVVYGKFLALGGVVAAVFAFCFSTVSGEALHPPALLFLTYPFAALLLGGILRAENLSQGADHSLRQGDDLFRQATLASKIGVWQMDTTTSEVSCSENVAPLLGFDPAIFPGSLKDLVTQIHPEDVSAIESCIQYALETLGAFHVEFRTVWPGGDTHWYTSTGNAQQDSPTAAVRLVGIVTDITDQKRAQRRLQESEARLAESQQIARIGSWIWREGVGFTWCSDAMCELLGAKRDELDANFEQFLKRIHPSDRRGVREAGRALVLEQRSVEVEWRLQRPGASPLHMFAIARPHLDGNGNLVDYRGICQDITVQKEAERELREREERYRRLVERLPICIHELDLEGNLVAINKAGLDIVEASEASEICGRRYLDLLAPQDRDRIRDLFQRALQGEASEFEITPPIGGRSKIFHSSFIPLRDDEGKIFRIMGHTVDLTQERAREADLRRLGTAIEQAVESIVITDCNSVIQYVNPAYERITGFSRAESIGSPISMLKSGLHESSFYDSIWQVISSGQTWQGEFLNRRKNGEVFHQRATISPIVGDNGEVVNFVSVQHDITHEVELEKQLHRAQKMESLGTLAGGIAHDFNNILHAMMGHCHIAMESSSSDPETLERSLREIEQGASRAADLVEQILIFSRTSGARFSTISLTALVDEALRLLRGSLPASIKTALHVEPGDDRVFGDPSQLHQLVTNLCTNAFHAMEEKGGNLDIALSTVRLDAPRQTLSALLEPGDYRLLRVADNGVGIDPANFDKLFDPFFTTKIVGKGTGLGLSMVHGIVTRMEGGIDIESTIGVGTSISVYLPISGEKLPAATADHITAAPPAKCTGSILLVDDDESITNMIATVLQRKGFEVTTYNHPVAALEALELGENGFDIAICDLTMPEMNGIELAMRLRELTPDLPVLLATGVIDDDKLDAVQESGIREVLRKPFHINELLSSIHRHIRFS